MPCNCDFFLFMPRHNHCHQLFWHICIVTHKIQGKTFLRKKYNLCTFQCLKKYLTHTLKRFRYFNGWKWHRARARAERAASLDQINTAGLWLDMIASKKNNLLQNARLQSRPSPRQFWNTLQVSFCFVLFLFCLFVCLFFFSSTYVKTLII